MQSASALSRTIPRSTILKCASNGSFHAAAKIPLVMQLWQSSHLSAQHEHAESVHIAVHRCESGEYPARTQPVSVSHQHNKLWCSTCNACTVSIKNTVCSPLVATPAWSLCFSWLVGCWLHSCHGRFDLLKSALRLQHSQGTSTSMFGPRL